MSETRFERLLKYLPRIADVINSFQSVEVQKEVYGALIAAFEQQDEQYSAHRSQSPSASTSVEQPRFTPDPRVSLGEEPDDGGSIHSFINHP